MNFDSPSFGTSGGKNYLETSASSALGFGTWGPNNTVVALLNDMV